MANERQAYHPSTPSAHSDSKQQAPVKVRTHAKKAAHQWRPVAATVALIVFVAISSFAVTRLVGNYEERHNIDHLIAETESLASEIEHTVGSDLDQVAALANLIASISDPSSEQLHDALADARNIGAISRIELLLPDGADAFGDEATSADAASDCAAAIAERGPYVSERHVDPQNPNEYIVRLCAPVVRDGKAVAVLSGVMNLTDLQNSISSAPYGGEADLYLLEGDTGDFLIDAWHGDGAGNIWKLGKRSLAPGFDGDTLEREITEGSSGFVVFASETTGENLYFAFAPVRINEWRVALSVPESLVFENAKAIQKLLNGFLIVEIVCFIAYFVWMLHFVRCETSSKQRQLDTIGYIHDVEEALFTAHENAQGIYRALERVGRMTTAGKVGLWIVRDSEPTRRFTWIDGDDAGPARDASAAAEAEPSERKALERHDIALLLDFFERSEGPLQAKTADDVMLALPELATAGIASMIAIPVKDADGSVQGVLAACSLSDRSVDASLLFTVEYGFSMFCRNLQTYDRIKEQGETDALTGLHNRARFTADTAEIASRCTASIACIYLDANGLHELNNSKGHDEGDRMLREVARHIAHHLGDEYAYRIGGDEFVVFALDAEAEDTSKFIDAMVSSLAEAGINISAGVERREGTPDELAEAMDDIIAAAERKMYQAKRAWYQKPGNDRRARE